jgi:UDP-2-acetamido-2-deoxy-ribo-hexuluronate aminotransferase
MNAPLRSPKQLEFTDLKPQYQALKSEIDRRIQRVLDHGQFIMGPEVAEMESALAAFVGVDHCISCSSGTDALLLSLMALGVQPGDEVITTPFTFAATAEVICLLGARPVFVDVDPQTALLDLAKVTAAITRKTKAIMPVSLYGQTPDFDTLNQLAQSAGPHPIPVIEDAAQSFGALYKGRRSGGLTTLGCTSFFPSKPLGCYGDGGAVFTNDSTLAQALRQLRVHGQARRYFHTRVGLAARMDTLQCAVILGKLPRFLSELDRRQETAVHYTQEIIRRGLPVGLLHVPKENSCVWAQYTIFVNNRDQVAERLEQLGVPTAVHYPIPLNAQPAFHDPHSLAQTPQAQQVASRCLSLPMGPDMTSAQVQIVVDALEHALA